MPLQIPKGHFYFHCIYSKYRVASIADIFLAFPDLAFYLVFILTNQCDKPLYTSRLRFC
jgi:hypothetical protein